MSRGPRHTSRINFPPRSIFIKLDLGISPPILNRFLRFQWRCNLLIHTFPTMYNMTHNCHILEDVENGFLTCNDCDVLRAKTGIYRWDTHRTIILPTARMHGVPEGDGRWWWALNGCTN